jgi:hypothetical protein
METPKQLYKLISRQQRKDNKKLPNFYDALINYKSHYYDTRPLQSILLMVKNRSILANLDGIRLMANKTGMWCISEPNRFVSKNGYKTVFIDGRWRAGYNEADLPF